MKKILLLLGIISITLTGCSSDTLDISNIQNKVKFTMPNRGIEDIHEDSELTQETVSEQEQSQPSNSHHKKYIRVAYEPMTKAECLKFKGKLGLKYCPYDNDHLAGVAKACGHIKNVPTGDDLHKLALQVYHTNTPETSIYGQRDDKMLKNMGIYEKDSHIFYWTGEEYRDGERGFVRMFASRGTIPYYASRDGSGYYTSNGYNKVKYGETKYIKLVNTDHDSNLAGLPNNDVLMAICYK